MAGFVAVPNVFKVMIGGFCDPGHSQNWANVLHFQYSGPPPSSTQLANTASNLAGTWGAYMPGVIVSGASLDIVRITDLTSQTSGQAEWLGHTPGTRGDDQIPANAAVLVTYTVGMRYRGGKPRTYLLAGGFADLSSSVNWNPTFIGTVELNWRNFLNAASILTTGAGSLGTPVCVRYRDKTINPTPPHTLTNPLVLTLNVANMNVEQAVASQRGRIGRSKRNASGGVP